MSVNTLTASSRAAPAVIDIIPEVHREGPKTIVGFTASTPQRGRLSVRFEMEGLPTPSDRAATEAMMLASIALAMQQGCALRVHGEISRSLRHSIDLYQETCVWWWPERYRKVDVEVDILDDQPPPTTRGVLCFSGGADSTFSAQSLGGAAQIEAGLLLEGYDIDIGHVEALRHQRERVTRLLSRMGLATLVMRTNVRDVLGQEVIEGGQGSYLAAALTLLSDDFGRGFVSSNIWDLGELGYSDPLHEAMTPLLGSTHFPIQVYGGHIPRLRKLRKLLSEPALFQDIRVCAGRTSDGHCGRCSKCLFNSFACVAMTGEWPPWITQAELDISGLAAIPATQEYRRRYAREILDIAANNGVREEWTADLARWLGQQEARPSVGRRLRNRLPPPLRRQLSKLAVAARRFTK